MSELFINGNIVPVEEEIESQLKLMKSIKSGLKSRFKEDKPNKIYICKNPKPNNDFLEDYIRHNRG